MRLLLHCSLRVLSRVVLAGLVLGAVLSLGARYLLATLSEQRAHLEQAVSSMAGAPVTLGRVHASWRGLWPRLRLDELKIAPGEDGSAALRCRRIEATLGLFSSLLAGEPRLDRLRLDGLEVTLRREPDGRIDIAGLPPSHPMLLSWLLRQRDIELRTTRVVFEDALHPAPPLVIEGLEIAATHKGEGSLLQGRLTRPGPLGEATRFDLILPDSSDLATGELQLALHAAVPAALLPALPALDQRIEHLDGRLGMHWREGRVFRLTADLQALLPGALRRPGAERWQLRGYAVAAGDEWRIEVDDFSAGPSLRDHPAPPWLGTVTLDAEGGRFMAATTQSSLEPLTLLPPALLPQLAGSTLNGELRDLKLGYAWSAAKPARWFVAGRLTGGGLTLPDNLNLSGLGADFAANQSGGAAQLDPAPVTLEAPAHLVEPLRLEPDNALLRWEHLSGGPRLQLPQATGRLQGLPFQLGTTIDLKPQGAPRLELELTLGPGDLPPLMSLLPRNLLHPRGEAWFRQAFERGHLEQIDVSVHGDLAHFPFDDGEGVFAADFAVSDTTLHFSDKWLPVSDGAAHGSIAGRHLGLLITRGRFVDSPAGDFNLSIADLYGHDPVLMVKGTVDASFADTRETLANSLLRDSLGQRLEELDIGGRYEVNLDLALGLRHDGKRTYAGSVGFRDNTLLAKHENLTLRHLTGRVNFTDHLWSGSGLKALFDQRPVTLSAHGGAHDGPFETELVLEGSADPQFIEHQLTRYAPSVQSLLSAQQSGLPARGSTDWRVSLGVPPRNADGSAAARQLTLTSSLRGLALDLPRPLAKSTTAALPLKLETALGASTPHVIRVSFGDDAVITALHPVSGSDAPLIALDVALGGVSPALPPEGLNVHGTLQELPLDRWLSLLAPLGNTGGARHWPVKVGLTLGALEARGQRFETVTLNGQRDASGWQFGFAGPTLAGTVALPSATDATLEARFERLWLKPLVDSPDSTQVDPRSLPPVTFNCESFHYGSVDFGQTRLQTRHLDEGLRLEALEITNPAFDLTATGYWLMHDGAQRSNFSIEVKSSELGRMLAAFGYDVAAIRGGRTTLGIEANWAGMPSEFALKRLDGTLALRVRKGSLLNIEPGGGRLFGLLSLQMLPRRLLLDFADLYDEGFAFDRIDGQFTLGHGNAETRSLVMEGPAARIEVSGRTGLVDQDYDQRAVVTPALSSTLPLAGALFGPAGIGVGAALYLGQQVFKELPRQLDRFISREYTITGKWQDPRIEQH